VTLDEAIDLIRPGIIPVFGTWADIGAGTGLFTMALMQILEEGKVIAVDKSPHGLYEAGIDIPSLQGIGTHGSKVEVEIKEGDFHRPLHLPTLDGIIMANSLHYANDHVIVLKNVLTSLKPGGSFILLEYDTIKPNPPWVPNPVSLELCKELFIAVGLNEPQIIGRKKSVYNDGEMYVVKATYNVDLLRTH
jgi:SAM-dependent methyltransferase